MDIEEHLDWTEPCIWVKHNTFDLDIREDEVEITCDWDYGWGGRGTERMFIDRKTLLGLMEKLDSIKIDPHQKLGPSSIWENDIEDILP
jgi:hypothetical protein